jgi:tetratricopeptide (TPR) repeat protein
MIKRLAAASAIVSLFIGTTARADDHLHFGPPPKWVEPVIEPQVETSGGALGIRLLDGQTHFDSDGTHQFVRQILAVNAAEGLQQAGTIGAVWQPTTDRLTFHKAVIYRGGKEIDVLKDGKSFSILRRESGLETFIIDGRLTATMQVPDLRVGDELEFAYTLDSNNPLFAGHVETTGMFLGWPPIDRLSLKYLWPRGLDVRWRAGKDLPAPVVTRRDDATSLTLARDSFAAPAFPDGAPARYADNGRIQLSDYPDWRSLSRLMAPLYEKAATLTPASAVRAEIAKIAAATQDPKIRGQRALALVQSQVRYFADINGLGGNLPANADDVWSGRVGDCKGKTVLLIAVLRGLGIAADPALVSVSQSNGIDQSLPMAARFDHVIVRTEIDGRTYWLDGTRPADGALDQIAVPRFEWALPLTSPGSDLVRMIATPPALPSTEWRLDLDARKGIKEPAKATGEGIFRGEAAMSMRAVLTLFDPAKRDQFLRKLWGDRHDWIDIETVGYRLDDAKSEVRVSMTAKAPMDWNLEDPNPERRYEANKARLGNRLSPDRKALPAPDVPVVVDERYEVTRQTILLPQGGRGFYVDGEPIDENIGGVHYLRTISLKGDRFDVSTSTRGAAAEISVAEAKAADKRVDALFGKQLFLRLPADFRIATPAPLAPVNPPSMAGLMPPPVGSLALKGDYKGALAALDAIIGKSGRSAKLLAYRAQLLTFVNQFDDANADADAALALNPNEEPALLIKMALLLAADRGGDALILLDRLILMQPARTEFYVERASVRTALDRLEGALADYDIVLIRTPDDQSVHAARIRILMHLRRGNDALAEADMLIRSRPNDAVARALRGEILAQLGRGKEAAEELTRSLALLPNIDALITRLNFGLSPGPEEKLADMLAVIRLEPTRPLPATALVPAARDAKAFVALRAAYIEAEKRGPNTARIAEERSRLEREHGLVGAEAAP